MTKSQSSSRDWHEQRKGRITASKFHDVHSKIQALSRKGKACRVTPLILAIVEPNILLNIPSLEWGKQNEKNAAEAFMQQEGKHHENAKLIPCGLYLYKPHPYIGATPDNIFQCKCCSPSLVEYKCPFTIKKEDIQTSWNKTDFLVNVDDTIKLKRSHKYFTQVTGQMAVTGLRQTYFVVYTKKSVFVEKIQFDERHWQKICPSLMMFFKTYIQRYLLGSIEIFTCPICEEPCLNERELDSKEENSIQCVICDAWYHWRIYRGGRGGHGPPQTIRQRETLNEKTVNTLTKHVN